MPGAQLFCRGKLVTATLAELLIGLRAIGLWGRT